jgi:hypothetical protein
MRHPAVTPAIRLITFLLLAAGLLLAGTGALAQASATPQLPAASPPLPAGAVVGSTPERLAAWNGLTPAEQAQVLQSFQHDLAPALQAAAAALTQAAPPASQWVMSELLGQAVAGTGPEPVAALAAAQFSNASPELASGLTLAPITGPDLDHDGLPDNFESAVADEFTPLYHVSTGEKSGTGFANFGNYVPMTVIKAFGPTPPISYYRVTPVGFAKDSTGKQFGFLEIDYLTLWTRDDGLQISTSCQVYSSIIGGLIGFDLSSALSGLGGHLLDDEHSAALVAAPTSGLGKYSTDPATYAAYSYYTAAHEFTFFDHSTYLTPSKPVPPNNHLLLALSRSKHSTYDFNPDQYPLFPESIIAAAYFTIDDLYNNGFIDDYQYLLYLSIADTLFYSCVVEHFGDQGGLFAASRINVGEERYPINGCAFIQDPNHLAPKLNKLLWVVR